MTAAASSSNLRGAGLMMGAMAAYTLNDTCIKFVAEDVPLWQVVCLRGVVTTALLFGLALATGALRARVPPRAWRRVGWRTLWEVASMVPFFIALTNMPLANVTAILAALPLTVTAAAAIWLKEPVGWRRFAAIGVGFVGVVMIVQPGTDGFTVHSLFALVAVVAVTARDMVTRGMAPELPSVTVALITAAAVGLFGGVMSLNAPWVAPGALGWTVIGAAALFIIGGYLFSVMVMRVGEVGFTAPFRYTSLVWALVLGWLVFGDWPNTLTMLGGCLVVATGLFTLYRERAGRRRIAALASTAARG